MARVRAHGYRSCGKKSAYRKFRFTDGHTFGVDRNVILLGNGIKMFRGTEPEALEWETGRENVFLMFRRKVLKYGTSWEDSERPPENNFRRSPINKNEETFAVTWAMLDFNRTVTMCRYRRLARGYEFYFYCYKKHGEIEKNSVGVTDSTSEHAENVRRFEKRPSVAAKRRRFFDAAKMFTLKSPEKKYKV